MTHLGTNLPPGYSVTASTAGQSLSTASFDTGALRQIRPPSDPDVFDDLGLAFYKLAHALRACSEAAAA